jgi:hypothetical protein
MLKLHADSEPKAIQCDSQWLKKLKMQKFDNKELLILVFVNAS